MGDEPIPIFAYGVDRRWAECVAHCHGLEDEEPLFDLIEDVPSRCWVESLAHVIATHPNVPRAWARNAKTTLTMDPGRFPNPEGTLHRLLTELLAYVRDPATPQDRRQRVAQRLAQGPRT